MIVPTIDVRGRYHSGLPGSDNDVGRRQQAFLAPLLDKAHVKEFFKFINSLWLVAGGLAGQPCYLLVV